MDDHKEETNLPSRDDALFETLKRNKKKKRRKTALTVTAILLLLAVGLFAGVTVLQRRVQENFAREAADVQNYAASRGTVSTTVSGTGVLSAVDSEQITVPYGVKLEEITAEGGDCVKAGEALATVQMASVMQVLSDTRKELTKLDNDLNAAGYDTVSAYVNAGVGGRVKRIWARPGDNVVDCMTDHGALAVISLDGCMAAEIGCAVPAGSTVTVRCADGKEYPGSVESSVGGKSVVTLTDDGPVPDGEATVLGENGEELGSGKLYVHSPLAVTGYAGTISGVYVKENQQVGAWSTVFVLSNTGTSANYDALLQSRHEAEERQRQLIEMLRTGAVTAPFDGTISSIDYQEESSSAGGYTVTPTETAVLTMAPDEKVCVVLSVDESDILSLEPGARAEVTVSSAGEETYVGEVTEVSRVADSSSGMTWYSATVTLPKTEEMLSGMTAEAEIRIHGVDNAILIPVDALHQTRDTTFVYTSYDPATQQYGGMREVTAGVSNSSYVEIVSGLDEGDTVYYTKKQENDFFAMMMGGGPVSGGNRPQSGGSRPQNGRNGRGG